MSYGNSTSRVVDRDALREQQRQARAQLADNNKDAPPLPHGLFGEPIKVAPSSDDALGKRVKRTLGEYDVVKETISSNPKNLIGITRQPSTPLPNQLHHDQSLLPPLPIFGGGGGGGARPPHLLNGQLLRRPSSTATTGHTTATASLPSSRNNEAVPQPPQRSHQQQTTTTSSSSSSVEFARPRAVAPLKTQSSSHMAASSSHDKSKYDLQQQQQHATLQPGVNQDSVVSPPGREKTSSSSSRSSLSHHHHQRNNRHHEQQQQPTKQQSQTVPASDCSRKSNGTVVNGGVVTKQGYSRTSTSSSKPNLKLVIDNQGKGGGGAQDSTEVESILKEMIAPTPLSGIPTSRKQDSSFPFPNASIIKMEGQATSGNSKPKLVSRMLDLSSCVGPTTNPPGPPHSAGILKEDLAISEDSDDETGSTSRKHSVSHGFSRFPASAVVTQAPPPPPPPPLLSGMSPNSESISSESEGSTSGSDTDNSDRSHDSEGSDDESRPISPKVDQIWTLDNFIKSSSQPVPFGLASDLPAVHDQESMSFDVARQIGTPVKSSVDDDGGFDAVPAILNKDFSKEDIKNLIPSPPPEPLETIEDFGGSDVLNTKVIEEIPPMSPLSPPPPSSKGPEGRGHFSKKARESTLPPKKQHSSSKHVKDVFTKKNSGSSRDVVVKSPEPRHSSSRSTPKAGPLPQSVESTVTTATSAELKKSVKSAGGSSSSSSKKTDKSCADVSSKKSGGGLEAPPPMRHEEVASFNMSLKVATASSPASSRSDKRISKARGHDAKKQPRSQSSQKFKSKEYISDSGESSDSESEIVDVVGTTSPVKMGVKGAAGKAKTHIRAGDPPQAAAAASAPPLAAPVHKKARSGHLSASKKDLSSSSSSLASSSSISSSSSSSSSSLLSDASRSKSKKAASFLSEDLSSKMAPLSPICDKLSSHTGGGLPLSRTPTAAAAAALPLVSSKSSHKSAPLSIIVNLNISMLDRVPPYPPVRRTTLPHDVSWSKPCQPATSSSQKCRGGSGAVVAQKEEEEEEEVVEEEDDSEDELHLPPPPPPPPPPTPSSSSSSSKSKKSDSRSSSKRSGLAETSVGEKKRKLKVAVEVEVGATPATSLSFVRGTSSKPKSVEPPDRFTSEGSVKEDEVRVTDVAEESTSRERKKKKNSSKDKCGEMAARDVPATMNPTRISRDREIQLPTREEPVVPKVEPDYGVRIAAEATTKAGLSPMMLGSLTPTFDPDSQGSTGFETSVKPKHRMKEHAEPEFKRRKADGSVSSQKNATSKWEPPKIGSIDSLERSTNHDRIPVARVRPNTDCITNPKRKCIELNEKLSSPYYLEEAKKLKHEADRETDRTKQTMLYLEAVLYFILTGEAMEREHLKEHVIYQMFHKTVDLIKYVATNTKYRGHQTTLLNETIGTRLSVLSLRCQALLHLKLFNMKKKDFHECQRFLMDHLKCSAGRSAMTSPQQSSSGVAMGASSMWNSGKSMTSTPSPMSPLPSPAGSPQAQASVSVPANLHSAMVQQLTNYQHLSSCHEMWEQADIATVRGRSEEFFAALDQQYGKITIHSSLRELVRYVQHGLYLLKGNT